ncbi:MAG: hypothetical protein AAGD11_06260 [Planctomycetota bacterium]
MDEVEAEILDDKLRSYVHYKMKKIGRRVIHGETADDISNTAWSKSLSKPPFLLGKFPVRLAYLKTTANRHMMNLLRSSDRRPEALKENWDKVIINHTAVLAADVADRLARRASTPRQARTYRLDNQVQLLFESSRDIQREIRVISEVLEQLRTEGRDDLIAAIFDALVLQDHHQG